MALKLPNSAEAVFRIEATNAFECRFAMNVYGAHKSGWFVATHRYFGREQDSGLCDLPKGEWATFLHLVEKCGFWALPEHDAHLVDANAIVEDGEWLTIAARDRERYHRIHRFIWREPGLDALLSFAQRVSGFFVKHPVSGFWVTRSESAAQPQSPDAMPGTADDGS